MCPLIEKITIDGYRGFKTFEADGFRDVNLITGKNNAGKSTLLEAIHILLHRADPRILGLILQDREEFSEMRNKLSEGNENMEDAVFNLFNSRDTFSLDTELMFRITAKGAFAHSEPDLTVKVGWPEDERHEYSSDVLQDHLPKLLLTFENGEENSYPLIPDFFSQRRLATRRERAFKTVNCIYLDSFSSKNTGQLADLWDAIALTDVEEEVVKALQLIAPEIAGVSMVGGANRRSYVRIAIVRIEGARTPVPLRSFGDGVTRVFALILSLINAKDGVLLVDEIENGLHHSVQSRVWSTVFTLAKRLNVQVFATTHSQDCIRAFQRAAEESEGEDGALIRLTRKGEQVIPTAFTEKDLQIIAENDIEVR